eukprot:237308-Pelagomonas_calceolata.AAC.3
MQEQKGVWRVAGSTRLQNLAERSFFSNACLVQQIREFGHGLALQKPSRVTKVKKGLNGDLGCRSLLHPLRGYLMSRKNEEHSECTVPEKQFISVSVTKKAACQRSEVIVLLGNLNKLVHELPSCPHNSMEPYYGVIHKAKMACQWFDYRPFINARGL